MIHKEEMEDYIVYPEIKPVLRIQNKKIMTFLYLPVLKNKCLLFYVMVPDYLVQNRPECPTKILKLVI